MPRPWHLLCDIACVLPCFAGVCCGSLEGLRLMVQKKFGLRAERRQCHYWHLQHSAPMAPTHRPVKGVGSDEPQAQKITSANIWVGSICVAFSSVLRS